jgi:hypothetical protein
MGELARRRGARDLWISRGHLWAAGLGVAALCVGSFGAGVRYGRDLGVQSSNDARSLGSPAEDGALVDLVARVEATATPDGGVRELRYPEALAGGDLPLPVPADPHANAPPIEVPPSAAPVLAVDPIPEGTFGLIVGRFPDSAAAMATREELRAKQLPAWLGVEREGGDLVSVLWIGGFAAKGDAERARDELTAALGSTFEVAPLPGR